MNQHSDPLGLFVNAVAFAEDHNLNWYHGMADSLVLPL